MGLDETGRDWTRSDKGMVTSYPGILTVIHLSGEMHRESKAPRSRTQQN